LAEEKQQVVKTENETIEVKSDIVEKS